jgi:transcriptional regulator with XRE-family HTH domain
VDLVQLGLGIRALRRRRGWRQRDLAAAARVSQTTASLIERGHSDKSSLDAIRAVAAALDARLVLEIRWRAGDLDRLLDTDHARLSGTLVRRLQSWCWDARIEVTYVAAGRAGSIDILAWHAETGTLLVIEVKTAIASGEATMRKLDEKVRIAADLARERFGWAPVVVGRLLAVEDTSTNRRRIGANRTFFDAALPVSGLALRRWLASPAGASDGLLFVSSSDHTAVIHGRGGQHRVRRPVARVKPSKPNVAPDTERLDNDEDGPVPTVLVGYERPSG